jgi:RNA polymerase sigma-70 factor (ECF subfamily)
MPGADVYTSVTAGAIAVASASGVVARANEGRIAALFDAHHVRLYKLARRMSGSPDEAKDLVQETFLRAARSVASVPEGESAEEAWLVRVLINLCRDEWRRRARRGRVRAFAVPVADARSDPEAALIARTTLWRALQSLQPRRRAAIVMHELEGAAIPDIAGLLGISAVTVRWHLARGRRELANLIRGL